MNTQLGRIYGRFSSKPQERGDSKRRQIEGAREYAKRLNIEIIGEPYFDEAVSGKAGLNLEREFGRLLKDAKPGEIILMEALDRAGRQNPLLLGAIIYNTTQKGVSIHAWQEGKVITPENIENMDTQFSVFTGAAVGHAENKRKMTRISESNTNGYKLAANGKPNAILAKYLPRSCFRWINDEITINEEKAKVIRNIFNWFVQGVARPTICKRLNEAGVPTLNKPGKNSKGIKIWRETTLRKILQNESYAGVLRIKGHKFTCIPEVIPHELWETAQDTLEKNKNRHGKGRYSLSKDENGNYIPNRTNTLFPKIAVCAKCKGNVGVVVSHKKADGTANHYYRCLNAAKGGCTDRHIIPAYNVEQIIFQGLLTQRPLDYLNDEAKEAAKELEAEQSKAAKLEKKIQAVSDMVKDPDCDFDAIKEHLTAFKADKVVLDQRIKELRSKAASISTLPENIENLGELVKQDLENNDIRIKVAGLTPTVINNLSIGFGEKRFFQVQLANGFFWHINADWTKTLHAAIKVV